MTLYPLIFKPILKDYLWGGQRIAKLFGKAPLGKMIAESWEISDREEGQSIVANGPLKGTPLSSLVTDHSQALFGPGYSFDRFPLLLKIIDAAKPLSIQVHPDSNVSSTLGDEPKTECWHLLECSSDAKIYAGLIAPMTSSSAKKLADDGVIHACLQTFEAKPSQTYFIPSGTVHAIGAGCLLLEVQQNSNTTYRLDDWGRVDSKTGKPRELHKDKAIASMSFDHTFDALQPINESVAGHYFTKKNLVTSSYFQLEEWSTHAQASFIYHPKAMHMLFCKEGEAKIETPTLSLTLKKGDTCLIPHETSAFKFHILSENLTFIHISLPRNGGSC